MKKDEHEKQKKKQLIEARKRIVKNYFHFFRFFDTSDVFFV